jgi:hypothetical protein
MRKARKWGRMEREMRERLDATNASHEERAREWALFVAASNTAHAKRPIVRLMGYWYAPRKSVRAAIKALALIGLAVWFAHWQHDPYTPFPWGVALAGAAIAFLPLWGVLWERMND